MFRKKKMIEPIDIKNLKMRKKEKWYKKIAHGAKKAQEQVREFHTGVQTIAGSLEPPDFRSMFGEPTVPKPRRIVKGTKRKRPRKVVTEYY